MAYLGFLGLFLFFAVLQLGLNARHKREQKMIDGWRNDIEKGE